MGTVYSTFETNIRLDIGDTQMPAAMSASELDRHVDHAVRDLALVAPLDLLLTATLTPNSRDVDLSATLSAYQLLRLEAVEWPISRYPQEFVQFRLFGEQTGSPKLTLLVEQAPTAADTVNLYCKVAPAVTSSSGTSTLPGKYDEIVTLGAAGYAAQALAAKLQRTPADGTDKGADRAQALSTKLLADFGTELKLLENKEQFFQRKLYVPEYPPQGLSQTEVYPPDTWP